MEPVQDEIVGSASRTIWVLQAAVGLVLLIACANLANLLLARAETRHREFAVRTALGAGRGRLLRQFITEGVLLSVTGGAIGLVLARAGVQALIRWYPTSLPRTSEVAVDPAVLLFTLGVSVATGIVFGLAPLTHTRMKRPRGGAEGGRQGRHRRGAAPRAARHWSWPRSRMAVMLVIGAGLLLRTVYNLASVDAGFDRSRLVTFSMSLPDGQLPAGARPRAALPAPARAAARVPGVQGASAMSGLPPDRPVNANDTDIDNYTAPPEGPFENVDYYQNVMTGYFETMGIPIVAGRGFAATDAARHGHRWRSSTRRWSGRSGRTATRSASGCGPGAASTIRGSPSSAWPRTSSRAASIKKTGTELYFLVDQTANVAGPAGQRARDDEHRAAHDAAAGDAGDHGSRERGARGRRAACRSCASAT